MTVASTIEEEKKACVKLRCMYGPVMDGMPEVRARRVRVRDGH
jgi:hypothetical protein